MIFADAAVEDPKGPASADLCSSHLGGPLGEAPAWPCPLQAMRRTDTATSSCRQLPPEAPVLLPPVPVGNEEEEEEEAAAAWEEAVAAG